MIFLCMGVGGVYLLSNAVGGNLLGLHVEEIHLAAEGQKGQEEPVFGHLQDGNISA